MASLGYHGFRSFGAADTFCTTVVVLLPERAVIRPSALAAWIVVVPDDAPNSRISVDLSAGSRGLKPSAQEPNRK